MLALLPLPGHPLQARYYGTYVVERKVGSVDYVITTSDCRKQRQLCHINIIMNRTVMVRKRVLLRLHLSLMLFVENMKL